MNWGRGGEELIRKLCCFMPQVSVRMYIALRVLKSTTRRMNPPTYSLRNG